MTIEEILMRTASSQGFFAVLFVGMLIYQLHENKINQEKAEAREEKLTRFLDDMKEQFAALVRQYERLSDDVEDIKEKLDRR